MRFLARGGTIRFRPDDGSGGGGGTGQEDPPKGAEGAPEGSEGNQGGGAGQQDPPASKTFTQEEVGRLLKQERKAAKEQAAEETRRAKLDELERVTLERDDAVKQASAAEKAADERIVRSEARAMLLARGYSADQAKMLTRAMDLSAVELVDGEPDAKALEAAVESVADVLPAAGKSGGNGKGAADFQDGKGNGKRVWKASEVTALVGTPEWDEHQADIIAAQAEGRYLKDA